MNNHQINGDALRRAVALMFGLEAVDLLEKVYTTVNEAQQAAFFAGVQQGHADGVTMGQAQAEERISNAFDNGFSCGHATAEEAAEEALEKMSALQDELCEDIIDIVFSRDNAWENGYLNGVDDARVRPATADQIVQRIIHEQAGGFFDDRFCGDEEFEAEYSEDEMVDELIADMDADWSNPIIK